MLTKEAALARLRKTGTLEIGRRPDNVITKKMASNATAKAIAGILEGRRGMDGQRVLAPGFCHGVLP